MTGCGNWQHLLHVTRLGCAPMKEFLCLQLMSHPNKRRYPRNISLPISFPNPTISAIMVFKTLLTAMMITFLVSPYVHSPPAFAMDATPPDLTSATSQLTPIKSVVHTQGDAGSGNISPARSDVRSTTSYPPSLHIYDVITALNDVVFIANEAPEVDMVPGCSDKDTEFMALTFLATDLAQTTKADLEGFAMRMTMSLRR